MNTTIDHHDLSYLCKQIHESLQIPVLYKSDASLGVETVWGESLPTHPFFSEPVELLRSVVTQSTTIDCPVLLVTDFREQLIYLPVKQNGQSLAFVVIGPTLGQQSNDEIFANILNDYGITHGERPRWLDYWNRLPVMNRLRMLHIAVLTNWMINREALEITDVLQSGLHYGLPKRQKENVELALADLRESSNLHWGIENERQILALIRSGDKNELMKLLSVMNHGETGVLSKRSQLRSLKNFAICAVAVSMRAAVEGGLYAEMAYTLSDLHIQHIEELNEAKMVETAALQAMLDFAERVSLCQINGVSRPVHSCMEYIYSHLFEELTKQKLSDVAGLNPSYLSQLFKKETGLTLMNYIQRERILEAKRLLDHSNDPISTIGARLTFYDQAHFIKVFKKHAGVTPRRYRNRKDR